LYLIFLALNNCNCNVIDKFESVIVIIIVIELKWCNWSNSGVGLYQQPCKYKKRNLNGGHDDFLLNCTIGCWRYTADLAFIASRLSRAILQESITSKWWLSSKLRAGNFNKKLFKLVN